MKRVSLLLVFAFTLSLFLFSGCEKPSAPPSAALPSANLSDYTIVYPDGEVSSELRAEIWGLQKTIQKKFGIRLTVALDRLNEGQAPGPREILIGRTNRAESRLVLGSVPRANDKAVRIVDEKLVITASKEEGLIALLRKTSESIEALPQGSAYFFSPDMESLETGAYDTPSVQIGDTDLSAFVLIFNEEDYKTSLPSRIQTILEERYQYVIEAYPDTAIESPANAILVGKTRFSLPETISLPGDCAYVTALDNGNLYLYAEDSPALLEAVTAVFDKDTPPGETQITIQPDPTPVSTDFSEMRVMSYNIYFKDLTESRAQHVLERIRLVQPDILGVQEATPEWVEILTNALDEYGYVGEGREPDGSGEHSGIFYNKNRYRLLDSGTKWMSDTPDVPSKYEESGYYRVFSYALLEGIEDGKSFVYFNTHADFKTVEVTKKQLTVLMTFAKEHFAGIPMILTGDLNQREETDAIQYVLNNGMDNGARLALRALEANTSGSSVIDFCMVSEGDFTVFEYAVDTFKYGPADPSDHNAIYIRCQLN